MDDRPSVIDSGRSFLFIAPEMRCLDIVRMIVPPRSSHPFGIPVIWNYIRVICELFVADGALPVLFHNLPIQQFPHFSRRPEFAISSRMMRILNASNPRLQSECIGRLFTARAGDRSVDWAVFIAMKSHSNPPVASGVEICGGGSQKGVDVSITDAPVRCSTERNRLTPDDLLSRRRSAIQSHLEWRTRRAVSEYTQTRVRTDRIAIW